MRIPDGLSEPVRRRVRVLLVRQRLEQQALLMRDEARSAATNGATHRNVAQRLMLLTAGVEPERWSDAFGLARQAASVYRETSAVLHSNRAFADVPEVLVREWEQVTTEVTNRCGRTAPAPPEP